MPGLHGGKTAEKAIGLHAPIERNDTLEQDTFARKTPFSLLAKCGRYCTSREFITARMPEPRARVGR
jgi:hypothetical protein